VLAVVVVAQIVLMEELLEAEAQAVVVLVGLQIQPGLLEL
jgi:hypothetical protein